MGPKAKAGKGKKETDEERIAREAEEKKAADLEAKKRAKEAEVKREEELKIQSERKLIRETELERLNSEYLFLSDKNKTRSLQREAEEALENEQVEWKKFKDPKDQIDTNNEKELNTFITLTRDSETLEITECINTIKSIETVADEVEQVWSDAVASNNYELQVRCRENLAKFYDLIISKIDLSIAQLLRFIDNHLNEKYEINFEEYGRKVSIGMWGCMMDRDRPTNKNVAFEKMNVNKIVVAKPILVHDSKFIIRVIRIPIDFTSKIGYERNHTFSTTKYVIGDLILLDLLLPPPSPVSIRSKKWTIRDRSDVCFNVRKSVPLYPTSAPTKCFFTLPDEFPMNDDIKLMIWDDQSKVWCENGIADYQYNEENRLVSFQLTAFGTFAFVRDRSLDFPYKKWSLSAKRSIIDKNTKSIVYITRFSVTTQKNVEVIIDICGSSCKLVKPSTAAFQNIVDIEMSPGLLLSKLQQRGVNIFPTSNDPAPSNKKQSIEIDIYKQIARSAHVFDFQSSNWGHETTLTENQVGILARESTIYLGGFDHFDYECILCEADSVSETYLNYPDLGESSVSHKFTLVLGNEYGSKKGFSHTARPKEVTHLDIVTTMASRVTSEGMNRLETVSEIFVKTVETVLILVKPFSYTL